MAWRLDKSVVRGEIDNRDPGRLIGRIWLVGRKDPVVLDLKGNALKDLAGCLLQFSNPAPVAGDHVDLNPRQEGVVGDITGSRKVRVPDVSIEEMMRLAKAGKKFPEHMGNCLYVEWFSQANGRVVIESVDYRVTVSAHKWRMTAGEERAQLKRNAQAIRDFLDRLAGAVPGDESPAEEEPYKPMDEFEWEKFMKESDKRTDRYAELLDKYEGHPDREKLVAREMGWKWMEEALEADERGKLDKDDGEAEDTTPFDEDDDEMKPNPLTEEVDWVRDEHGHPQHPLVLRSIEVTMGMWHKCKAMGLIGEKGDAELRDMLSQAQITSAKLAGGLNDLAYDHAPEGGFVTACLKRALGYLHKAIGLADKVAAKSLVPGKDLTAFRNDLFAIREEILQLMKRFRGATF